MTPVLVEACVTSLDEAVAAAQAGADRLELCRNLDVGGLTPDSALMRRVVAAVEIPIFAMVRPRGGAFDLRPDELGTMERQTGEMLEAGADGIVLGVLDGRGRVDRTALERLMRVSGSAPVTFHKAFDEVPDLSEGLRALIDCGVARVLTSGGEPSAWEGRRALAELVRRSERIAIMAGGGVRANHVRKLVEEAGLVEVHARAQAVPALVAALRE